MELPCHGAGLTRHWQARKFQNLELLIQQLANLSQQKVVCLRIAEHCNYGKYDIAKTTGKINKQRKKVCFTDQKEDVGSNCFE